MKTFFLKFAILPLICLSPFQLIAQNSKNDGDWAAKSLILQNTPEAQWMIRLGDIDNLGFGWDDNFNPFNGNSTNAHPYPWEVDSTEVLGMDMIMLPSSFMEKDAPCGSDGYSGSYEMLQQRYKQTAFELTIPCKIPPETKVESALIMLFIDDFQAPSLCSHFEVSLNGRKALFLETILNEVDQTGPIGKLITLKLPQDFLDIFSKGKISLLIDDKNTGAGDGFAIDFVKFLVNPVQKNLLVGNLKGTLKDEEGLPIPGISVMVNGVGSTKTDEQGNFYLQGLPAGLNVLMVDKGEKKSQSFNVDIVGGETTDKELIVKKGED